jgi:S-adenosylmethionine decarboxylase
MDAPLGRHLLVEYYGCDRERINDVAFLRTALLEAATRANATIVEDVFHTFNPQGVSGVVVIAESHIAVHTWPERGCAAVDIFSCSDKMLPEVVVEFLKNALRARTLDTTEVIRGKKLTKKPQLPRDFSLS